jgi:hypothetical protein
MQQMNLTEMGKAGLTGPRGKVGARVAQEVAQRTRYSEDQVKAVIGGILLILTAWQFVKLVRSVIAAGRRAQQPA